MLKNSLIKVVGRVIKLKRLLNQLGMSPIAFILPAFLGMIAALFEGAATALLLPIMKGVMGGSFDFVKQSPYLKYAYDIFPYLFHSFATVFIFLLSAIFVCTLIKLILQYGSRLEVAYQIRRFTDRLRRSIFDRYLSFGKLFFDRANIGNLDNALLGFTRTIGMRAVNLQNLLNLFMMLIVYLLIMLWLSWRLTLLSIIIFPIFNYSIKWIIDKIKKVSVVYSDRENFLSQKVHNVLFCIPLVKAYDMEEDEKREFAKLSDSVREIELNMDKKNIIIPPLQEIISFIPFVLLISYITFKVVKVRPGELSSLLVFFYTFKKASNLFGVLGNIEAELAILAGPIKRIMEIFDDRDKYFIHSGKEIFGGLKRSIEICHLNFLYTSERKILQDINLSIERGKMTAIVGETGGGKTTIISLLMRFYDCPPQSIKIDGTDIREFESKTIRAHMALVSQDTQLFNDTLAKNIKYGLKREIGEKELDSVIKKARLHEFVASLPYGLDTYIGDRGVRLSGGEKQRVAIARALLKRAEIIILDEATSSLDSITEKLIQEAIDEMVKDKTVIVIAHRLSTIKNADKIIVIEKGSVVEEGSLQKLLDKKGRFWKYWEEQKFY